MKPTNLKAPRLPGLGIVLCLACFALALPNACAQELVESGIDPKLRMELGYAQFLKKLGFPELAMDVLETLKGKDPKVEIYIELIELESLIAVGKFDEAKAIISKKPDQESQATWAMKLTLADGYFAWGRYAEAQGIYQALFTKYPQGPPTDLNDFYMNSAYKYSQMLLLMGEEKLALAAYDNVMKAKLPQHVLRQVWSEKAELLVKLAENASTKPGKEVEVKVKDPKTKKDKTVKKPALSEQAAYFKEIEELTTKILWQQDVWFGKAIVILAHMRKIQGDIDGAMKLVEDYKKQLKDIDEILKQNEKDTGEPLSKLSPMAECRYLVGVILQDEAEKLIKAGGDDEKIKTLLAGSKKEDGSRESNGALQHFLNVFIGYPETGWAPDAGARAKVVENILVNKYGAKITSNVSPEKMARVERAQFQNARTQFNQQQFENAADSYIKVLNLFPRGEQSVAALGELSRCYVELQDDMFVDLVVNYLSERFSQQPDLMIKAGDQMLRTAEMYSERNILDRKEQLYSRYFDRFPDHPLVPTMLFRFGEEKVREERFVEALPYYQRITGSYSNAPVYGESLNKITYCYSKTGDLVEEIKALEKYIGYLEGEKKPGHALISAKFRVAAAYKKLDPKYVATAYNRFSEIVKMLTPEDHPYNVEPGDEEKNRSVLEGCMFFKAVCLAQIKVDDAKKVAAYKAAAIKALDDLLERFPKSQYAPSALSQIGTLYTVLGDAEAAGRALRRLKKEYPDSVEAKNARFVLAMNLLELGMRQQAVRELKGMLASDGDFSAVQILTAARELVKAKEYDIAVEAFDKVLTMSDERAIAEPALLDRGRALIEQNQFAEGAKSLEEMLEKFPNSGYTVQACLELSRAYSELGAKEADDQKRFEVFNQAVNAMKTARKFERTPGGLARLDIEIARIMVRKAKAEEQFGTPARALQYRNEAIATYQTLALLADPNNTEVRPHIADAIHECMPLFLATERWQDTIDSGEQYQQLFPNGRHLSDIRAAMGRAKVKTATTAVTTAPEVEAQ